MDPRKLQLKNLTFSVTLLTLYGFVRLANSQSVGMCQANLTVGCFN